MEKAIVLLMLVTFILHHEKNRVLSNPVKMDPEVREVSKNVYSFAVDGGDSPRAVYSMFIVTSNCVIAIEPYNIPHATRFLAAIKRVTKLPIRYLLITHNHWDHARGGKVFADEGATVLAHQEAVAWMKDNPREDLYIPDETWEGTQNNLYLGGVKIELHFMGVNHGNGMSVFLVKNAGNSGENVAFIADLVFPQAVLPVPDFNMKELERTLNEILNLDIDRAVFAHSAREDPLAGGTEEDIELLISYIVGIRTGIDRLLKENTPLFEIPNVLQLPEFSHWLRYDTLLPQNIQKFIFESIIGPYPWRQVNNGYPTIDSKGQKRQSRYWKYKTKKGKGRGKR